MSQGTKPKHTLSGEEIIRCTGVNKWYGEFHVLKNINLNVQKGERIVVCGPSGSGKSTMIRCLNRLEEHQKGTIVIDGIELTNNLKNIELVRREVGMVFQHFNLFPHLTVLENCTLAPIWVRKMPKAEAEERAMSYLTRVRIAEQAKKYPGQLSGGQQQRVAIARSLHEPEGDAVRRADLRARPRNGQGGAGRHDRVGRGRHDHAVRDARDGLRQVGRRPRHLHGPRRDRGAGHAGRVLLQPQVGAHAPLPQPNSKPLIRAAGRRFRPACYLEIKHLELGCATQCPVASRTSLQFNRSPDVLFDRSAYGDRGYGPA